MEKKPKPRTTVGAPVPKPKGGGACGTASSGEEVRHVSVAPCSLSFTRDGKGQPRWELKLYCERDQMHEVITETLDLDRRLREETRERVRKPDPKEHDDDDAST